MTYSISTVLSASSNAAVKLKSEREAEVKLLFLACSFKFKPLDSTKDTLFSDRSSVHDLLLSSCFILFVVTYVLNSCDVRL